MKKSFNKKVLEDKVFEIVKKNIDNYKSFICDKMISENYDDDYTLAFTLYDFKEKEEIIKLMEDYNVIIFEGEDGEIEIFDNIEDDVLFEMHDDNVKIYVTGTELEYSINFISQEEYNKFIQLLLAVHHHGMIEINDSFFYHKLSQKKFYDNIPNEAKLIIELEYPELSCSDDVIKEEILKKVRDRFSDTEIELLKQYLKDGD